MAELGNDRAIMRRILERLRILERRHGDLDFFTEDFRSNSCTINAHVLTNLELLNRECKRIGDNKAYIEALEKRVAHLEGGMKRMLGHLEIEEKARCECGRDVHFVMHRGVLAKSQTRELSVQTKMKVTPAMKDLGVQTDEKHKKSSSPQKHMKDVATQSKAVSQDVATQMGVTLSGEEEDNLLAFPPPTQRMVEEAAKVDEDGQPGLLCSRQGVVAWTLDAEVWRGLVGGGLSAAFSPAILLPVAAGRYKVWMRIYSDGEVRCYLDDDDYNRTLTALPMKSLVQVELKDAQTDKVIDQGEGIVNIQRFGGSVVVCDWNRRKFYANNPPKCVFYFHHHNA